MTEPLANRSSLLLINPPYHHELEIAGVAQTTVGPPMGLAYLAAVALEAERDVGILDANALGIDAEATVSAAVGRAPAVVGLTATTATIHLCARIAEGMRQRGFGGPILIGGAHPTAMPLETLREFPVFDVAVVGEAEEILVPLLGALEQGEDLGSQFNIAYRADGHPVLAPTRSAIPDLDALPRPALHLLPLDRYYCPDGRTAMTVIANRGCPAGCTYCTVPLHFGRKIRRRSPESVATEVLEYHQRLGITWVNFIDDTFTWDEAWVSELCRELHARDLPGHVEWQCLTRVDQVRPALFEEMAAAGCRRVEMGIEAASPKALKRLKKGIDRPQVVNAFRGARRAGLETLAFAMVNVPGETLEDIRATTALLREIDPDYIQASFCTPYPGTRLYEEASREGMLRSTDWQEYRFLARPVLDNGVLSEDEVRAAHRELVRGFWLRPKTLGRIAWRILTRPEARITTLRVGWHGLRVITRGL